MVFYLAFTAGGGGDFVSFARAEVAESEEHFRARFEPAIRGLELAVQGIWSTTNAFAAGGGRVFTGWSVERHWLLPPAPPRFLR